MKIYSHNNVVVPSGVSFELEGIAYPWNWFDLASNEDLANHGFTVEETQDPKRKTVYSSEIVALFSPEDVQSIKTAINASNDMFLLWSAFQTQSEPMHVENARFIQGWQALKQVVGVDRMASIASQLNLDIA